MVVLVLKSLSSLNYGLTLVELLVAVAIIALLSLISWPTYRHYIEGLDNKQAVQDLLLIDAMLQRYHTDHFTYPDTLQAVGLDTKLDPWGNNYEYLNIATVKGKGKLRKDHNLVPINSDYDLYSKGKDGRSVSPLTAKHSRDDIIRANNGGFTGLAADY